MAMNRKAQIFKGYIDELLKKVQETLPPEEQGAGFFHEEEIDDDMHTVIFRTNLEVTGVMTTNMIILIDESPYTVIRVGAAMEAVTDANKDALMAYMDSLNRANKLLKYYDDEDGNVVIEVCIMADEAHFDADIVLDAVDLITQHLKDTHAALEKAVNGEN
ncbi:MAG: hypothetical protein ACI4OA_05645 [Selenomonadaceae bacterium]